LPAARLWLDAHGFDTTRVLTRPAHYLFLQGKLEEPARTLDIELLDAQRVVALIDADSPALVALSRRHFVTLVELWATGFVGGEEVVCIEDLLP